LYLIMYVCENKRVKLNLAFWTYTLCMLDVIRLIFEETRCDCCLSRIFSLTLHTFAIILSSFILFMLTFFTIFSCPMWRQISCRILFWHSAKICLRTAPYIPQGSRKTKYSFLLSIITTIV
jgi:hypothetical protein